MPRDPTHTPSGHDPDEAFWAEIIRYELDSWNPRQLPRRFHPRSRQSGPPQWRHLPKVVAVCVLVLLVVALGGFDSNLGGVRDSLIGIHPAANHAGQGHGGAPASSDAHRPSRSSRAASSPRTGSTPALSPGTSALGLASGPRAISPAPSAGPPTPTLPPDLPHPTARTPRLPRPTSRPVAHPGNLSSEERAGSAGRHQPSPGQ